MTLTVAREGQSSAQIDILREDGELHQYVGCLVLEDLSPDSATELDLVIGLDDAGTVDARVSDSSGAQYQSLSVNLQTLDVGESYSLPDDDELGDIGGVDSLEDIDLPDVDETGEDDLAGIDLDQAYDAAGHDDSAEDDTSPDLPDDLAMPEVDLPDSEFADTGYDPGFDEAEDLEDDEEAEVEPRPFSALVLAAVLLIGLSLVALGAYAVFRWLQTDALPDLRAAFLFPLAGRRRFRPFRR